MLSGYSLVQLDQASSRQARYFFILFVTKNAKVSLMIYSPSPTRLHTRARSVMSFASFPWLWAMDLHGLTGCAVHCGPLWSPLAALLLCCPPWAAVLSAGLLSRSSTAGLDGISSRDPRQQRAAGRQAPRHQLQGLRLWACGFSLVLFLFIFNNKIIKRVVYINPFL